MNTGMKDTNNINGAELLGMVSVYSNILISAIIIRLEK